MGLSQSVSENGGGSLDTPCNYSTESCINFNVVNKNIIHIVNKSYYDLQSYAILVFDRTQEDQSSLEESLMSAYRDLREKLKDKSPYEPFKLNDMIQLNNEVAMTLKMLNDAKITGSNYVRDLDNISFFSTGDLSSSILLEATRKVNDSDSYKIIIKIVPLQLPDEYQLLVDINAMRKRLQDYSSKDEIIRKRYISVFIESPLHAIFLKEAWMYCFTKTHLRKYTPTFTCIANCYVIEGFPFNKITFRQILHDYESRKNKKVTKKWLDNILSDRVTRVQNDLLNAQYGCFEMQKIEGTLGDLIYENKLELSIVIEYLYTKLVAAFIGRIVYTDDHVNNVAYVTVNKPRHYEIQCNGFVYNFYCRSQRMVQFIDLERYVFNFSKYDVYSNGAMKLYLKENVKNHTIRQSYVERLAKEYIMNPYIMDKSIRRLLDPKKVTANNFIDKSEYDVTVNLLKAPYVFDVKGFAQTAEYILPKTFLSANNNEHFDKYSINLDDDSLRVIKYEDVFPE